MTKEKIIKDLIKIRIKLINIVVQIDNQRTDEVFLGIWSIRDLLAHLIGWDIANLNATQEIINYHLPFYFSYYDENWEKFNAMLVKKYKKGSLSKLISAVKKSQQKLIKFLNQLPASKFDRDYNLKFKGWKITVAGCLLTEIEDERVHYRQILNWLKTKA